jgi:hypothetical protein
MYQHPIPQNVTSYQFRLVGDLTLKQFLEFLIGVGLAVLFYFSNLYAPLKAVLMGASVVFGIALAFIPIEERPLDQWVIAFFRAIYRPTQFIWRKQPLLPEYFSYQVITTTQSTIETSDANAHRKQAGLTSYMQTLPTDDLYNDLDTQQHEQLNYVTSLFSSSTTYSSHAATSPNPPTPSKAQSQVATSNHSPKTPQAQVHIPVTPETTTIPAHSINHQAATLPPAPETVNTITGVIITPSQNPLENVMIEILDESNTPVRATKTNKLGQFFSSTPLKNGTYTISVEADGYNPGIISFEANGQIIPPVVITINQ